MPVKIFLLWNKQKLSYTRSSNNVLTSWQTQTKLLDKRFMGNAVEVWARTAIKSFLVTHFYNSTPPMALNTFKKCLNIKTLNIIFKKRDTVESITT